MVAAIETIKVCQSMMLSIMSQQLLLEAAILSQVPRKERCLILKGNVGEAKDKLTHNHVRALEDICNYM